MDKEDVRGLMMELCAVGTDFDQMKVEELHKACAILEHMTSFKARDIIKSAGTRPVLQVYMSDGWCTTHLIGRNIGQLAVPETVDHHQEAEDR